MKKENNKIAKEVIYFLQEREEMIKAGFPLCYKEKGVAFHCKTCQDFYNKRKLTHK